MKKTKTNFSILLITGDKFLEEIIRENFSDCVVEIVGKKAENKSDIIIFDNEKKIGLLEKIIKKNPNVQIINLTSKNLKAHCLSLPRPFRIKDLVSLAKERIKKFQKTENKILLKDCEVFFNQRQIIKNGDVVDNLTEKEVNILNYLSKKEKANRDDLIKNVWGYSIAIDTKIVESNIYKLRQKFIKKDLRNPVKFENGYYFLDKRRYENR